MLDKTAAKEANAANSESKSIPYPPPFPHLFL